MISIAWLISVKQKSDPRRGIVYILGPSRVGTSLIKFRSFALLIFGERPEWFAHDLSFLLSDLSESLIIAHLSCATWAIRSLRSEEMSESIASLKKFKKMLKTYTKYNLLNFFEGIAHLLWAKEKWAICSKKTKQFAHLSWATRGKRSHLLICHERPERFAHSRSFVLSYLSESLTFAHFSSAIWANEQLANFQPWDLHTEILQNSNCNWPYMPILKWLSLLYKVYKECSVVYMTCCGCILPMCV